MGNVVYDLRVIVAAVVIHQLDIRTHSLWTVWAVHVRISSWCILSCCLGNRLFTWMKLV